MFEHLQIHFGSCVQRTWQNTSTWLLTEPSTEKLYIRPYKQQTSKIPINFLKTVK